MNPLCAAANAAWIASSLPATIAFRAGFDRAAEIQRAVLRRILERNAGTAFGRDHGFASIRSTAEYQERVPVRTYDDLAPYLDRTEEGEPNVLTAAEIDHFEPTSGSSGRAKLIPYTRELRDEFGRAIGPWIGSLAQRKPRAFLGHSYWSLTPAATESRTTAGGTRIGFDDDSEYLGSVRARLAHAVQVIPPGVRDTTDIGEVLHETLESLKRCRDLSLISVWHPSFLLLLVESVKDIAALWPKLSVISCWADAGSATAAAELPRRFPQASIEPKGLISTEGVVTIPFDGQHTLAYRSHFVELRSAGEVIPAAEASIGQRYAVILTTSGGLYRYATGDVVEVTGFRGQCPLLRFIGRSGSVSDHFGEKLNEIFVRERLDRVLRECGVVARFALIRCERNAMSGRYVLSLETDGDVSQIAARLDELLRENFHYDYCRRLGQLAPLEAVRADDGSGSRHLALLAARSQQRLGDIKPAILDTALYNCSFSRNAEPSFNL